MNEPLFFYMDSNGSAITFDGNGDSVDVRLNGQLVTLNRRAWVMLSQKLFLEHNKPSACLPLLPEETKQ